jgi:hypothetical protein
LFLVLKNVNKYSITCYAYLGIYLTWSTYQKNFILNVIALKNNYDANITKLVKNSSVGKTD